MGRSLLFPTATGLTADQHAQLADAYELACDELVGQNDYTAEQLQAALEPMTVALLTLFRAGQKDKQQLGRYAAWKAAEVIRAKVRH